MKKKILLALILTVIGFLISGVMCASAATSGTCGENLTWTLDDNGTLTISGNGDMYTGSSSNIIIPWDSHKENIVKVIIENGVTSIGDFAFWEHTNIESISIPDSVTTIGMSAIRQCESLKSITIPENVTTIGNLAFSSCLSLEQINWNAKNASDFSEGYGCFYNAGENVGGVSVVFGDTVEKIPAGLFYCCETLTKVTMGKGVKTIGNWAFHYNIELTEVNIPDSVTTIGERAFYKCEKLKSITIPENVSTIGKLAFYNCTALEQINWNAKNVSDFSDVDKVFGCAGQNGNGISVVFGDNTETIPARLFGYDMGNYIPKVTTVTIGENVTTIGKSAFFLCTSLKSIVMPVSVTSVDEIAFHECSALTDVYYGGLEEDWDNISIANYNDPLKNATIHFTTKTPAEKLCDLINKQTADSCTVDVVAQTVTLKSDVSASGSIEIPTGGSVVLNLDRYNFITDDCIHIPEEAEITITGSGIITNGDLPSNASAGSSGGSSGGSTGGSGGTSGSAGLIDNEGKLIFDGITLVAVGVNGISNSGDLVVNSGKIIVGSASTAKDGVVLSGGTITVNGGEIRGGDTTRDGRDGGDGISSRSAIAVNPDNPNYPIKLNGGIISGGEGLGEGESGRAISSRFSFGINCVVAESNDGVTYTIIGDYRSELRYLKVIHNGSDFAEGESGMSYSDVLFDGENLNFDLTLSSSQAITGKVYVAVFSQDQLTAASTYTAAENVSPSVEYAAGQTVKIFWWITPLFNECKPVTISVR